MKKKNVIIKTKTNLDTRKKNRKGSEPPPPADAVAPAAPPEDRCSTPECSGVPVLTHLERRLCQACWESVSREDETPAVPLEEALATSPIAAANEASWDQATVDQSETAEAPIGPAPAETPEKPQEAGGPIAASAPKRVSALDAAAKVLQGASEPMNCKQLVAEMARTGLWNSPAGKTPAATLYSAILREIATKGEKSRFRRADKGLFAAA